jgi:hypothetical protein
MLVVTRPALRPLTAASAAVMAGAVGAVPATAAGAPHAPAVAAHWHAPRLPAADTNRGPASGGEGAEASPSAPAIGTPSPPKVKPAAVNAATARDPGAPQAGLAARNAVVAGDGIEAAPPGEHGTAARAAGAPARARAPPR